MIWVFLGLCAALAALLFAMRKWAVMNQRRSHEAAQAEFTLEKLRFLQRLDHELKNPLTAMQIALANLDEATDPGKREEIRASMHSQLLRMSYLIGDLRKLATLGRGEIESIPVNTSDLLMETLESFLDNPDVAQRQFNTDLDSQSLPTLTGDRDLLQLAIYNLLDNARKFTAPGETIQLRAFTDNDHFIVQVIDTGCGIQESDLPHIWEDLYRSKDVQGIPGSGVGLAMVKGIVEQHGGTVYADSTFGTGTTITLQIPIQRNMV